jgi:Tetratricopeptide repeat
MRSPLRWPPGAGPPTPRPYSGKSSTPGCGCWGPNHPSTLTTGHEIAVALAAQGGTADAEGVFRQVLNARLPVLGPDHPSTITTRHNMAVTLAAQGKPADTEAEFRQVLDARLQVLGPGHPSTLRTVNWLNSLQGDGD